MASLPAAMAAFADAFSGISAALADMALSRLELAGLEAREAAVRLVQILLLTCLGCGLLLLGLGLGALAVILAVPPPWRAAAAGGGAALAVAAGAVVLARMRVRLAALSGVFAESLAALKKDRACF
ncbi:MAG: phage holin family protein [Solidesulfovibrio sp.]|uniref:phage holin family protein n=1 Tax=Solidesulfovibrio sp. TaxID=2910990 RepID=UPI002B20582C|nr:phage holin family protein [Solidesulfovibrio sp.]MEA4858263.1 phage holin family protein [Solidesulfovibrio sp.]